MFNGYGQPVSAQKRSSINEKNDQQPGPVSDSKSGTPDANVAGTLTLADPTFNRPTTCSGLSGVGTAVHHDVIPFTVSAAGTITLSLDSADGGSITPNGSGGVGPDTFLVLYGAGGFSPASPLANCLAVNDDISGATNRRSRISQALAVGSYTAVVTSFANTPVLAADDAPLPWTYSLSLIGVGAPATTTGQVIISEFRVRGPSGANDEFIELYNTTGAALTAQAADASSGLGVAASDGTTRCTIPNGTVIPAGGHYLCTNSVAYSLGGNATGDATYATDISDNAGIAIFNNSTGGGSYILANRLDAVGSTSEANTVYREGAGYPALTPFSIDYSFYRDNCGKAGSIASGVPCSTSVPLDTGNNAVDFIFVDTNGTSAGAGQRLGAPGPENLASPVQINSTVAVSRLDANVSAQAPPNQVRDFTSVPAQNSTFGTLDIRRRITNNTGASITRLRFRVTDQTTFPAPSGVSDLRTRTSSAVVVAGVTDPATCAATGAPATPPCTVTIQGTTVETPPAAPNGSAFNSTLSAGTVTLGTPLANGASINLRFLFGIQQTGVVHLGLNVEALPGGAPSSAAPPVNLLHHTDAITAAGVTVGGRALTSEGRGLRGARVTITDTNGVSRAVFTSSFGRFQFEDVEPGRTYIVSIGSRRYTFTPQTVQVNDNIADLNFVAGQ